MTDPLQAIPDREATPLEMCIYWSNQLSKMADDFELPVKAYEELKDLRTAAADNDTLRTRVAELEEALEVKQCEIIGLEGHLKLTKTLLAHADALADAWREVLTEHEYAPPCDCTTHSAIREQIIRLDQLAAPTPTGGE